MAFQTENTALIVMLFELPGALESPPMCVHVIFCLSRNMYWTEELFDLTDVSYCMKLSLIFIKYTLNQTHK